MMLDVSELASIFLRWWITEALSWCKRKTSYSWMDDCSRQDIQKSLELQKEW